MNGLAPIVRRELMSYFRSPVAYIFIIIFLVSTAGTTWFVGNFYQGNEASLDSFFFFHPWLYLFLIPAVGMRLWAEDRRSGTIELLLTLPVNLLTAVVGKFLAAWAFVGISLLLTFPMVITVYYLGDPDTGLIVAGYLGSFLMAGAYLAIACWTSSMTKNQVIAFVVSFFVCLIMVLLGWGFLQTLLVNVFPVWLADAISFFSFSSHFEGFHRGRIDVRDVIYFASIIGFMLFTTVIVLENRKAT